MTTLFLLRHPQVVCVSMVALLSACSVDRGPFSAGTGGGNADSGMPDGSTMDAAMDATVDAMLGTDAAPDALIEGDAGEDDAGSIDAGDGGGTFSCMFDQDCDPRVCHEANCAMGTCIYTPQPLGPATDVPQTPNDCQTIYCNGTGGLATFGDSLDPPLDDGDFCTLETCSNTTPVHSPLPDGTQLPVGRQVNGDCRVKRCTNGMTMDVPDNLDIPASSACEDGICSGGIPGTRSSSAGLSCGSTQVCDGAGACVACRAQSATCSDDWQCCGGNCVGGQCGAACMNNFADCDGMDNNGCETATNTLTNCGACGTTCNLPNAVELCTTGSCAITSCNMGFADCNMMANDGCEQSLRTLSNCGSCGSLCARANATATCNMSGVCGLGACNAGFGNCDSNATNGCETRLNTLAHCGGCNVACGFANAISTCTSGTCQRVGCEPGFDDCDGNASNGCEASLTSINHCGACGIACSGPTNRALSCDNGACNVGACTSGFQDCDGIPDNGCEWDVTDGPCPCVGSDDTDGDGLTNCDEIDDGDDFTDPDQFNGAHVIHYPLCTTRAFSAVNCSDYDTLGEVNACVNKTPREALDQRAGWDFQDPSGSPNPINAAGFGFLPNWSGTNNSFQLDAQAFIKIAQTGRHCFRVNGGNNGTCGSLYLSTTSATAFCGWSSISTDTEPVVQHGDNAVCLQLDAGVYPVRWHLDHNSGAQGDFHLDYCYGAGANCAPVDAIPSRMLRTSYTADCTAPAAACTQATYNGHDYWFCDDSMTWSAARAACQAVDMDLVAIGNAGENTFLTGLIDSDSWTALSDALSESTWMWMTTFSPIWSGGANGTPIPNTYNNWADGDPNGDNTRNCGELMTDGEWNDTTCGTPQAFICEEQ